MKKLLFLLAFLPISVFGQDKWSDAKYLAGTVPVEDGVVVFHRDVEAPGLTRDQIFVALHRWVENRFKESDGMQARLLYSDPATGQIVCQGQEYLVFTDKLLALDRAVISYQVKFNCGVGKCNIQVTTIMYSYESGRTNGMELLRAENMITDEHALSKKKDKLIRATGKFRIGTIDLVDQLAVDVFGVLDARLQNKKQAGARIVNHRSGSSSVSLEEKAVRQIPVEENVYQIDGNVSLQGYRQIAPEKIPGNIIKMLSEDWMLVTAGKGDKFNMMTAGWGGLGYLFNKPVAFNFINSTRYTYQLMEKDSVYTLSFYTEAYRDKLEFCGKNSGKNVDKVAATGLTPITMPSGAHAFAEAWLIIECRKIVAQSMTPEALLNEVLKDKWSGQQLYKFYAGEILRVWVK